MLPIEIPPRHGRGRRPQTATTTVTTIGRDLAGIIVSLGLLFPMASHAQRDARRRAAPDTVAIARERRIGEVTVRGERGRRADETAFNAQTLETRRLRNSNLDVAHALDRIVGVRIREDGGVGSAVSVNLNGFTGRHVRLFIDGVSLDGAASSFSIANIPASLTSRIEVYKGVMPVELGGDALGGAINIVTDHSPHTYVDASYSYGSFNTHRTTVSAGLTSRGGLSARLNVYQNSSDNDYRVLTQWADLQTNRVGPESAWFRRFHDRYHNEAAVLQLGVGRKVWADRLTLGVTLNREYAQIQHSNLMRVVFGAKHRRVRGVSPTLHWEKRDAGLEGLDLRLVLRYDGSTTENVDTAARTYSWTGEWRANRYRGESELSQAEFRGRNVVGVGTAVFNIDERQTLTLSDTWRHYRRKTTDDAASTSLSSAAAYMRRASRKNVAGLAWRMTLGARADATVFAKRYDVVARGPVNVATTGQARYAESEARTGIWGWGAAGQVATLDGTLTAKASYERTARLPTDRELFGDGDQEQGESGLRPEHSHNANLVVALRREWAGRHRAEIEVAGNYRHVGDYIIRAINTRGVAVSTNHGTVVGRGVDVAAQYTWRGALRLGADVALQEMRNRERLNSIGAPSATYGDRVPNVPYATAAWRASYAFHHFLEGALPRLAARLSVGYDGGHTHRFFRSWAGEGAKLYVPSQTRHNAQLTLSGGAGRYNLSFEIRNIGDALLYDNYSLQKPGRSMSVKFRYVLYK